jgi:hypothetical protein
MMSSTRKSTARMVRRFRLAAPALLAVVTGCAIKQTPAPDAVSHAPLVVDEAMQNRHWPVSVARYANGETYAWPTGFLLVPSPKDPIWVPAVADTPMFVANTLAMPVVYLFLPPFQTVMYPRGEIEPSYNAMPPLPAR